MSGFGTTTFSFDRQSDLFSFVGMLTGATALLLVIIFLSLKLYCWRKRIVRRRLRHQLGQSLHNSSKSDNTSILSSSTNSWQRNRSLNRATWSRDRVKPAATPKLPEMQHTSGMVHVNFLASTDLQKASQSLTGLSGLPPLNIPTPALGESLWSTLQRELLPSNPIPVKDDYLDLRNPPSDIGNNDTILDKTANRVSMAGTDKSGGSLGRKLTLQLQQLEDERTLKQSSGSTSITDLGQPQRIHSIYSKVPARRSSLKGNEEAVISIDFDTDETVTLVSRSTSQTKTPTNRKSFNDDFDPNRPLSMQVYSPRRKAQVLEEIQENKVNTTKIEPLKFSNIPDSLEDLMNWWPEDSSSSKVIKTDEAQVVAKLPDGVNSQGRIQTPPPPSPPSPTSYPRHKQSNNSMNALEQMFATWDKKPKKSAETSIIASASSSVTSLSKQNRSSTLSITTAIHAPTLTRAETLNRRRPSLPSAPTLLRPPEMNSKVTRSAPASTNITYLNDEEPAAPSPVRLDIAVKFFGWGYDELLERSERRMKAFQEQQQQYQQQQQPSNVISIQKSSDRLHSTLSYTLSGKDQQQQQQKQQQQPQQQPQKEFQLKTIENPLTQFRNRHASYSQSLKGSVDSGSINEVFVEDSISVSDSDYSHMLTLSSIGARTSEDGGSTTSESEESPDPLRQRKMSFLFKPKDGEEEDSGSKTPTAMSPRTKEILFGDGPITFANNNTNTPEVPDDIQKKQRFVEYLKTRMDTIDSSDNQTKQVYASLIGKLSQSRPTSRQFERYSMLNVRMSGNQFGVLGKRSSTLNVKPDAEEGSVK